MIKYGIILFHIQKINGNHFTLKVKAIVNHIISYFTGFSEITRNKI